MAKSDRAGKQVGSLLRWGADPCRSSVGFAGDRMKLFRLVGRLAVASGLILLGLGSFGSASDGPGGLIASPDRVVGLVVDPGGQPIAGAEVFAASDPGEDEDQIAEPGVAHQTKTDDSGRFGFVWPELATDRGDASIWVHRGGYRLARASVAPGQGGSVIRVILHPTLAPAGASLQVVGPKGEPVPEARIIPTGWYEGDLVATSARTWAIPRIVGDRVAIQTGADGRCVLDAIPALRLSAVAVESGFGSQVASWDESLIARHRSIKLRGVGRVVGQVKADDLAAIGGLTVHVSTLDGNRRVGRVAATTDRSGHFEVDKVAAGTVEVRVEPRPEAMELPESGFRQVLEIGGVVKAEMALRRGVRLSAIVRERGQVTPVPGAWVTLWGANDAPTRCFRTDEVGRFSAVVLAGAVTAQVEAAPSPFLLPSRHARPPRTEVPAAIAGFEWPKIELDGGVVLRGRTSDPAAKSVAPGVMVEARWTRRDGRSHDEVTAVGWTSGEGRFEVGPVAPAVDVALTVHRPGELAGPATRVSASKLADPIELTLGNSIEGIAPSGRVVDSTGRPVADALVQFRVADSLSVIRGPRIGRRIAADGFDAVVTDDQGNYQAPGGRLDGRHRYIASAEAAGYDPGRTKSVSGHMASKGVLAFPDLVLVRHPEHPVVVGRVVGTDGVPIAGVVVGDLARHQGVTDGSGWFRIEEMGAGIPSFLFARRVGYRFFGRSLRHQDGEADEPLTLVLIRDGEPVTDRSMIDRGASVGGPATSPRSSMVDTLIDRILARNDAMATSSLLEHLAQVEPGRVANWLKAGVVADVRVADGLRKMAAQTLAGSDFGAAEQVIASIEDPAVRARATIGAVAAAGSLDLPRKKAAIERAEREARSIEDIGRRAEVMARLAESRLDLGEVDSAKRCLSEAEAMAEVLPRATAGARLWCSMIRPMARVDPKLARKRLDDLSNPADSDRCRVAVALQLARVDPIEAARTFRRIRDPNLKVRATPEVCRVLALKDPTIARSLLESIAAAHPTEAAYALGMMAASLARTDRPAATSLLKEAFARLETLVESGPTPPDDSPDPAAVASTLLPIVESVDPSLIPEFFWKSVSFHSPKTGCGHRSEAILALMLDRYDRVAARLLFDPTRIKRSMIAPSDFSFLLLAAARLAPEIALQWVETRPEANETVGPAPLASDQAHLDLVAALTLSDPARRRLAARNYLQLWTPEDETANP